MAGIGLTLADLEAINAPSSPPKVMISYPKNRSPDPPPRVLRFKERSDEEYEYLPSPPTLTVNQAYQAHREPVSSTVSDAVFNPDGLDKVSSTVRITKDYGEQTRSPDRSTCSLTVCTQPGLKRKQKAYAQVLGKIIPVTLPVSKGILHLRSLLRGMTKVGKFTRNPYKGVMVTHSKSEREEAAVHLLRDMFTTYKDDFCWPSRITQISLRQTKGGPKGGLPFHKMDFETTSPTSMDSILHTNIFSVNYGGSMEGYSPQMLPVVPDERGNYVDRNGTRMCPSSRNLPLAVSPYTHKVQQFLAACKATGCHYRKTFSRIKGVKVAMVSGVTPLGEGHFLILPQQIICIVGAPPSMSPFGCIPSCSPDSKPIEFMVATNFLKTRKSIFTRG